jgi:hypothetical protein
MSRTDGGISNQIDGNGDLPVTLATALNKTIDTILVYPKARNLSVISKTTAVTIGAGGTADTILFGLKITAALTGTCVITGFADSDGAAQSITLPAGTPAGYVDFGGVLNSVGPLTITCSNAADDNLVSAVWMSA